MRSSRLKIRGNKLADLILVTLLSLGVPAAWAQSTATPSYGVFPVDSVPIARCHIFHALRRNSDDFSNDWVASSPRNGLQKSGRNGVSYFLTWQWGSSTEGPSRPGAGGD